jgi:hypothetical protein
VFRCDLFDAVTGAVPAPDGSEPADGIGAFAGPNFSATDIAGHLAKWRPKPSERPRLSLVR